MTWNYRIMRRMENGKPMYGIVEAHYTKRGDTKPHSWTQGYSEPFGETLEELTKDFAWFMAALRWPVLDEEGNECEPQLMQVDTLQKWIDEMADVQGEA